MIDSHCHLVDEKYLPEETEAIVQRAKEAGVEKFISAGVGFEHTKETLVTSEKYPEVLVAAGLGYEGEIDDRLATLLDQPKVVAIGECGLDEQTVNKELFAFHIEMAVKKNLPLIVHCRNMFEEVYEMIKDANVPGMMHCFTGSYDWMRRFVDLGWYISFGGIVTFKRSEELREVLRQTPQERILIETDSPYLAPEPLRGQRNEPMHLAQVAQSAAETRNEPVEAVRRYTSQNAVRLFRL